MAGTVALETDDMPKLKSKSIQEQVTELLKSGRLQRARLLVRDALSALPTRSRKYPQLLELLLNIELSAGRTREAMAVLKRRRSLGYRTTGEAFDSSLLSASILMKSEQWFDARAELTDPLRDPKGHEWAGILEALCVYVEADKRCQLEMKQSLEIAFRAAVERFGLPAPAVIGERGIGRAIKHGHRLFRLASIQYQSLVLRVIKAGTTQDRDVLRNYILTGLDAETVGYFRSRKAALLERLKPGTEGTHGPQRPLGA